MDKNNNNNNVDRREDEDGEDAAATDKERVKRMIAKVKDDRLRLETLEEKEGDLSDQIKRLKTEVCTWMQASGRRRLLWENRSINPRQRAVVRRTDAADILEVVEQIFGRKALERVVDEVDKLHLAKYKDEYDVRVMLTPAPDPSEDDADEDEEQQEEHAAEESNDNNSSTATTTRSSQTGGATCTVRHCISCSLGRHVAVAAGNNNNNASTTANQGKVKKRTTMLRQKKRSGTGRQSVRTSASGRNSPLRKRKREYASLAL